MTRTSGLNDLSVLLRYQLLDQSGKVYCYMRMYKHFFVRFQVIFNHCRVRHENRLEKCGTCSPAQAAAKVLDVKAPYVEIT